MEYRFDIMIFFLCLDSHTKLFSFFFEFSLYIFYYNLFY